MNRTPEQRKELAYRSFNKVNRLEKMVSDELLEMGFSYKHVGTYYLRDAIIFAAREKPGQYQTSRELMGRINTMVSNKHGVKRETSINQMRYSIECAFAYGNINYLLDIFKGAYDYDKGRVSNSTFIMGVAEKIKQDIAEKETFNATQLRILIQDKVENITDIITLGNLYGIVQCLEGGAL